MDFKQLTYFLTLNECKSFTVAAKQLNITQPNLTLTIKKLEKDLQVRLFERTKPLKLTDAGKLFLKYTKNALKNKESFDKEISDLLKKPSVLTIGVPYLLHPCLSKALYTIDSFSFALVEDTTENLLKNISSFDFCFVPTSNVLFKTNIVMYSKDFDSLKTVSAADKSFGNLKTDIYMNNIFSIMQLIEDNYTAYLPDIISLNYECRYSVDLPEISVGIEYDKEQYMSSQAQVAIHALVTYFQS